MLHEYARRGQIDLLKILIPKLEDKNPKDELGYTPLHVAAEKGHWRVVNFYKDFLADMNPRAGQTWYERTPLHCAATNGDVKIVKLLVSFVEDINP